MPIRRSPCDFATKMQDTAQGYLKCAPRHIGDPVVWTDGRTDVRSRDYYTTTKLSWPDRLPNLFSNGAPLACSATNSITDD